MEIALYRASTLSNEPTELDEFDLGPPPETAPLYIPPAQQIEFPIDACEKKFEDLQIGLSAVGQGAFASVYRVESNVEGKDMVLKVCELKSNRGNLNRLTNMIRREIEMSKNKNSVHKNMVTIVGCGETQDLKKGVLMPFCALGELFDYVSKNGGVQDKSLLCDFIIDLLSAVNHMHKYGIYHLDIKLENILVDSDASGNFLKITDYGLAHCDSWSANGDLFGSLAGTDKYFGSPKYLPDISLALSEGFIRKRDQWASGCVIYAMAYCRNLYAAASHDDASYTLVHDIIHKKYGHPPFFSHIHGLPPIMFVECILTKLISTNPGSLKSIMKPQWIRKWMRRYQTT